jgi:hypothetical protein
MAQNSNGKGRPVAYCWMKSETKENLEFLYRLLKLSPHIPEIKIILVDKDLTNLEVLPRINRKFKKKKFDLSGGLNTGSSGILERHILKY